MTTIKNPQGESFTTGDKCYAKVNGIWRRAKIEHIADGRYDPLHVRVKGGCTRVDHQQIRKRKPT